MTDITGSTQTRRVQIVNEKGLHARASAGLARLAEAYESDAAVRYNGEDADMRSVLDLLTLAAAKGAEVELCAEGPDAADLLDAAAALIANKFGEGA